MKLIIEDDEGRRTVVPFVRDELTIGRHEDNVVLLSEKNVSRKHGKLLRKDGRFFVEDLNSFTGIRVNGEKVHGKRLVKEGDLIQISEYDLSLQAGPDDQKPPTGGGGGGGGGGLGDDDDESTIIKGKASAAPGVASTEAATRPAIPALDAKAEAEAEAEARKNAETAIIRLSDLPAAAEGESRELPPEQRPRLVCLAGTLRGKEFVLDRTPVRIGRSDENDLQIDHPSISRKHCRLSLESDAWKVLDAESRNGVRVNNEPYATIGVHHGDTVELGHLKFAFVGPGQPFTLPPAVQASAAAGPSSRMPLFVGAAVAVAVVVLGSFWLLRGRGGSAENDGVEVLQDAKAERKFALRAADVALASHRYGEAVRHLEAASRAGATATELRMLNKAQEEAKAEDLFHELESAMGGQDFDRARRIESALEATPTYFGARAGEKAEAVRSGYANLHVAAAALAKGKDNGACLSEAQLALAVAPANPDALQLIESCKSGAPADHPAAAPRPPAVAASAPVAPEAASAAARAAPTPAAPAPAAAAPTPAAPAPAAAPAAPAPAVAASPSAPAAAPAAPGADSDSDSDARRLINEGNQKLIALDYPGAIVSFQSALARRPSEPVLANAYRSMGITFTRQGNAEEGAHYYKLYLPLCTNPTEKQHLQALLDAYEARRR